MRIRRRSQQPERPQERSAPPSAPPRVQHPEPVPEEPADTDVARRVLAHAASPEEKLERLLADRSRELEEQAERFELALQDLERREELLRDMRSSVERLLRLGATDLTEREAELESLDKDVAERRARLTSQEAELERRRSELGAVELKREAVELRERALAAREEELAERESGLPSDVIPLAQGDVSPNGDEGDAVGLLFVPGPAYRLVELESTSLQPGATVDLDGQTYAVTRIGPAPLPGDGRTCAYLEVLPPGSSVSDDSEGSS